MVSSVKPPSHLEAALGSEGKDLTRRIGPYVDDMVNLGVRNSGMNPTTPGPDDLLDQHRKSKKGADAAGKQADAAVDAAPAVSGFEKGLDRTEQALGIAAFAPVGEIVLNAAGGATQKIGGWTGFAPVSKAGDAMMVPGKLMTEKTLGDVGKKMGISGGVNRVAQFFANGTAAVVDPIMRVGGLNNRIANRHAAKAGKHFTDAVDLAGKVDTSGLHGEISGHMAELKKAMGGDGASLDQFVASKAALTVEKIEKAITTGDKAVGKSMTKEAEAFLGKASDALHHHNHAAGWRDVKGSIKAAPKEMAKASVSNGLMNGSFIALSGVSMVKDAHGFGKEIGRLKQLYADMTDTDPSKVSTMKILVGSVPAPIAEMRSHLVKKLFIKESTDAVGMAVNIKQAMDRKFVGTKAIAAFMLPQFIGMGADAIMGDTPLPIYEAMSKAHKAGQEVPAEVYAELLGAASKDLKARGGASSPFTQELAKQYAAEKASPALVMKEIHNGKMMERVNAITAVAAQQVQEVHQDKGHTSMVDTVQGNAKKNRPVIGEHTGRVAGDSSILGSIQRFI